MSDDVIPVTVRILDKEYKISCPAGEHESLMSSAKEVDENMRKIREGGKALGAERIAVMAALNISHASSNKVTEIDPSLVGRIDSLQQSVDEALQSLSQ